jgi:hypothetical protein
MSALTNRDGFCRSLNTEFRVINHSVTAFINRKLSEFMAYGKY